jgi:alanine racemase
MSNKILNSIQNSTSSFVGNAAAIKLDNISIDSRSLQNGVQTLFFALVGPNNDAHAYIKELIAVGVQNFVVTIPEGCKGNANFFVVENTTRFTRICSQLSRLF